LPGVMVYSSIRQEAVTRVKALTLRVLTYSLEKMEESGQIVSPAPGSLTLITAGLFARAVSIPLFQG
jgi:hypothetical protein